MGKDMNALILANQLYSENEKDDLDDEYGLDYSSILSIDNSITEFSGLNNANVSPDVNNETNDDLVDTESNVTTPTEPQINFEGPASNEESINCETQCLFTIPIFNFESDMYSLLKLLEEWDLLVVFPYLKGIY